MAGRTYLADGSSYEEALQNIKNNIDDWIEVANELGRNVPEPKGKLNLL